ncbi:hypothetical protein N7539_000554 [Penicillium diatomitis]|uniref:Aminotransferase class I/classII large domain-containing protein n=1 Tax=Penicillium diatomitis TaxID=2819901 RepID=A0A9W9XLZ3_9EURO|nr:uncharacterized protein N7539_000554 [Penicillium diatomitis]KAJ5495438.1 hypothetical protein N7539_000554 [Penicillium diatomitis]
MSEIAPFALPQWIDSQGAAASLPLAGSATPGLSVQDLIDLSTDKETTTANLASIQSLKMTLGSFSGGAQLRHQIAGLYNETITADHIFPTHGTTGANALLFQSLLNPGDHVIAMYPCYTQLISLPKAVPNVDVSYWKLDLDDQARPDINQLKALIRPTTKLIVVNNPNNPTGTVLSKQTQMEIVSIARSHNITVLADEIFLALHHGVSDSKDAPLSFVDLPGPSPSTDSPTSALSASSPPYENIIITSSMSKAWGLSGLRIGWLATRNPTILSRCFNRGLYTIMALSNIDELIAAEALSDRCRPAIQAKHLELARRNLQMLDAFVAKHKDVCSWARPVAGGTGFLRFRDGKTGEPVDDVEFCEALVRQKGVLLAPGTKCFGIVGDVHLQGTGMEDEGERLEMLRGFVRVHVTVDPVVMEKGLAAIDEFVREQAQ